MTDRDTAATVAANVHSARTRHGLSLDQLAARATVSKGALVAVENGKGNPSLSTLVRLADALSLSVSALVEPRTSTQSIRVVPLDRVAPLWTGTAGGTARLLLTTPGPAPVEVWRWRLLPGETHRSAMHGAGVHETVTVLNGTLHVTVDKAETVVATDATAAFAADKEHAYSCAADQPCDFLMTVHLSPRSLPSRGEP
ncbi:helix-turn-helix domain-containing protein [Nocardiopsis ansamitocini]|uniref:Transcriptional regulator n=1 Tax=Nocardiopsis ansamitocini TaxID=1670832 RepID=A0A9W6P9A0_9ACTN|nr:helix-turn-helix transcriptional regulator [Nocardiopsis ansamitocini]GLU49377.1 transcriptional regulator [Nocardiopsis ansamitocini]